MAVVSEGSVHGGLTCELQRSILLVEACGREYNSKEPGQDASSDLPPSSHLEAG